MSDLSELFDVSELSDLSELSGLSELSYLSELSDKYGFREIASMPYIYIYIYIYIRIHTPLHHDILPSTGWDILHSWAYRISYMYLSQGVD